jgi:UDP-N-acetylglucosamine acyltransferase
MKETFIHPTAVIGRNVKIGEGVHIGAFCIIGEKAEDKKHWNEQSKYAVIIEDDVIITGATTIDAGTIKHTRIGKGSFIMKGCHIGHDVFIMENAILSPHVVIGGHSLIGVNTNMGMCSVVHQRIDVPANCMIGMNATITKTTKLEPKGVYIGSPAKFIRWNIRK